MIVRPKTNKSLHYIVARLQTHHGRPRPPQLTDPLDLILFENAAYLLDDERRAAAFQALRDQVGTRPIDILSAPSEALLAVAKLGGMDPARRVEKLRQIAHIALHEFHGDLRSALGLPLPQAKKCLKRFPGIGDPGAEKILLFARAHLVLALDSNGLRVLVRIGLAREQASYAATYRAAQAAVQDEVGEDYDWIIRAHQLLRRHGQDLCRRSNPLCAVCPLKRGCVYYSASS
jgi:endonuclease III